MLLRNLNVEAGVCTGLVGRVVGLPTINNAQSGITVLFPNIGEVLVTPNAFEVPDGLTTVERYQYPLMLAYYLTFHRCQSLQLSQARMDLSDVFEFGMVYTGVSRMVALSGLKLEGLNFISLEHMMCSVTWFVMWFVM